MLIMLRCSCFSILWVAIVRSAPPRAVVMLLADDFGWWNVEMDGHNVAARTPHLHRLSSEGIRLERLYAYKYCSPTRSSLLTGRLPIHVNQNNEGASS
jgi:arylsulfatase B